MEAPIWIWCIISALGGLMAGFAIARSLLSKDIRQIFKEQAEQANEDLRRRMK